MKKRIISIVTILAVMAAMFPAAAWAKTGDISVAAQAETQINIGDYLIMGTYYDKPILWRCVDVDENGPLMLSDKILCLKAFDASGTNTGGSHGRGFDDGYYRQKWGSNYWEDSNIRDWLNSAASAGNVAWSCGNPPDADHIWNGYNAYDGEAGFLTNFTSSEQDAMKSVKLKQLLDGYEYSSTRDSNYHRCSSSISSVLQNYDTAYSEISSKADKMFLLDVKQVYGVYSNGDILGRDYYIGQPTAECVENSDYKLLNLAEGKNWDYWLRSLDCDNGSGSNDVRYVSLGGDVNSYVADDGGYGVRPAFYLDLKSSSIASGEGTEASPYRIGAGSGGESDNNSSSQLKIYTDIPTRIVTIGETFSVGAAVINENGSYSDLSGISFSVENSNILQTQYMNEKDGVLYCNFKAKETGSANIKITDFNTGYTAKVLFTVEPVMGDAYTINNFHDMYKSGITIDEYSKWMNGDGSCNIRFDAHNSLYIYGAVEVYNSDGKLIDAEYIDKYNDISDFKDIASFVLEIGSVVSGEADWRELASEKTPVDVRIPKGGYMRISANSKESVVCGILNSIDLICQYMEYTGELKGKISSIDQIPKSVIENIKDQSDDFLSKWSSAFLNYTSQEAITSESGVENFLRGLMGVLKDNDLDQMVQNTLVDTIEGTSESMFLEWFSKAGGWAGAAVDGIFTAQSALNTIKQTNQFFQYRESKFVTVQVPDGNKRVNSEITVEGNLNDDTALSVYKLDEEQSKQYLISIKELEQDGVNQNYGGNPTYQRPISSSVEILSAYDISLVNEQDDSIPIGDVEVTLPLPDELQGYTGRIKVYRIESDGSSTTLWGISDGTRVTVKTEHFSIYIIASTSVENTVIRPELNFTDVSTDAWFYDAVKFVVENGLFNGVSDTLFAPDSEMTRAMFVTVLGRLEGIDTAGYSGTGFDDVASGTWYSAYVKWASENGIVNGVSGAEFQPEGLITREQMAAIMYRYAKFKGIDVSGADRSKFDSFADRLSVSDYAAEAVIWATHQGIINGTGNGIAPKNHATRAQVAQIVLNYINAMK